MFANSITIDATPEQIWEVLADFPSHEKWNPQLTITHGSPTVGSVIQAVTNKGMRFSPIVITVDEPHLLQWKGKFLLPGIADGVHSWKLTSTPDGRTEVTQSEEFTGMLSWLAYRVFDLSSDFKASNVALATEVERRTHEQD